MINETIEKYLTEAKWEKSWYNHMLDKNNKKVYSWKLGDYKIIPTGESPTRGFNHKLKKTFWAILDPKTGAVMKPTYETLAKAKEKVEKELV